jgi:hypothetical protein
LIDEIAPVDNINDFLLEHKDIDNEIDIDSKDGYKGISSSIEMIDVDIIDNNSKNHNKKNNNNSINNIIVDIQNANFNWMSKNDNRDNTDINSNNNNINKNNCIDSSCNSNNSIDLSIDSSCNSNNNIDPSYSLTNINLQVNYLSIYLSIYHI